jgi:diadenosine tetraphosphate (Ap4A) HIT family hydrolase
MHEARKNSQRTGRDQGLTGAGPCIGCILCEEIVGNSGLSSKLGLYPEPSRRFLFQNEHFVLIPDISPIVPGHSLVVTRRHVPCFSALPPHLVEPFRTFLRKVVDLVADRIHPPLLFEHGTHGPIATSGACIQHAHVHVVPLAGPVPVAEWMDHYGEVNQQADVFSSDGCLGPKTGDYLACQDSRGVGYLLRDFESRMPSQFVRRRLAEHLGVEDWNWKIVYSRPPSLDMVLPAGFRDLP